MNEVIKKNMIAGFKHFASDASNPYVIIAGNVIRGKELQKQELELLTSWWLTNRHGASDEDKLLRGGDELWNELASGLDQRNILIHDLSVQQDISIIEGLTVGDFVDMFGRDVSIEEEDIDKYLEQTKEAIERSRTESGEVAGLPIDQKGHDKGEAAGWIVGVQKAIGVLGQSILKFMVEWNEVGREKIEKKILRGFSPTLNRDDKVVLGGSLTNWPASRDAEGKLLLRPLELSTSVYQIESNIQENIMDLEELQNQVAENAKGISNILEALKGLTPAPSGSPSGEGNDDSGTPAPNPSELTVTRAELIDMLGDEQQVTALDDARRAMIRKYIEQQDLENSRAVSEAIAEMRHETNVAELVSSFGEGSVFALSTNKDQTEAFVSSLNRVQFKFFQDFVAGVQDGTAVVDMRELGSKQEEKNRKSELPELYQQDLDSGTLTVEQLRSPILLGKDADNYDLSKWENN